MTRSDAQNLIDWATHMADVAPIRLARVTRCRGHAYPATRRVSVPQWALQRHEAYARYYVLHEAAHVVSQLTAHNATFFRVEDALLLANGLTITRSGCYANAVHDATTSAQLCGEFGNPSLAIQ